MRNAQVQHIPFGFIVWNGYTLHIQQDDKHINVAMDDIGKLIAALQNIRDDEDRQHALWGETA